MNRFQWSMAAWLAVMALSSEAEEVPLWEAGAGIGALSLPAYRGSNINNTYVLPVPYFTYNGEFFKADDKGVRGELFDNDRIDLNISASAAPPTKSDNVPERVGMPNLQPIIELGPELDITLWKGTGDIAFLKLRLPLREAFTVTAPRKDVGTIFSPNLNTDFNNLFGQNGLTFGIVTGPIFASQRQNAYLYSVDPQYVTATRKAYSAGGGYSGTQLLFSLSKRFDNLWFGMYVRHDTLNGAVFADSPLVAQRSYTSGGIALSWIFGRSSETVRK